VEIDHTKNSLRAVVRKLIKLDIFRMQKFKETEAISNEMHILCCAIFDLYHYDSYIVDETYIQETKYYNLVNEYDGIEHSRYEPLTELLNILKELMDIVSDSIYYICQGISNEKYPMYEVENMGWKLIYNFCEAVDIPRGIINDLSKTNANLDVSNVWRLLYKNPNCSWYDNSEATESLIRNKKGYLDSLEVKDNGDDICFGNSENGNKLRKMLKEHNNFCYRQSSNCKQVGYLIENELNRYSIFDADERTFEGLNHSGFSALLTSTRKLRSGAISAISKDISEKVSNNDILKILEMFPELGISASLFESKPFYSVYSRNNYKLEDGSICSESIKIGNPVIKYASIGICKYTKWHHEYNGLIGRLFHSLKIDLDLLNFSSDGTPIIKLY
jgi:hypothetical protein